MTVFFRCIVAALCVASCGRAPAPPPRTDPPAPRLLLTDGRFSLQTSAFVELHAMLAAAARETGDVAPELDRAKLAYGRAFAGDDAEARLRRTTRAIAACDTARCVASAFDDATAREAYRAAVGPFVARAWAGRAAAAWRGIEAVHASLEGSGSGIDPVWMQTVSALGIAAPDVPANVVVVAETEPAGRVSLAPTALAARGSCFLREGKADDRTDRARILDCVLVHALGGLPASTAGPLRETLVHDLGEVDGGRAWEALLIHVVALAVRRSTPNHRSVYRRSAEGAEPRIFAWLAEEVPKNDGIFVFRYVAAWREAHSAMR